MKYLNPCPKCGCHFIGRGKACSIGDSMVVRIFKSMHAGFTCAKCGYYAPTARKWNRRAE